MPPTAVGANFVLRGLQFIAQVLIEPSPAIRGPDARRKARLQSALLLINMPFMFSGAASAEAYVPGISMVLGAAALIVTTAYLLSRTAYYRVGGVLAFGVLAGLPFANLTLPGGYPIERVTRTFIWLIVPVLWSSMFFSRRGILSTTGLLIAAILAVPLFIPAIPFGYIGLPAGFVGTISVLTLVMHWHRSQLEQDRLAELSNTNRELAALSDSLETRIQERTFELKSAVDALQEEVDVRQQAEQATLQRNQELAALNQIGQALNQLADPAEMLDLIQTTISWIIDTRNLYIALYDEAANVVSFPLYNIDGERRPTITSRPFGNGLTEHVILAKAPLLITHNMFAALEQRGIGQIGRAAQCYLAAPMIAGDKVIGVIAVQDYEQEYAYNSNHEKLLFTIASQAAIALENSRLFAALQQELAERQRAEAALREAETRYRSLVEHIPIVTYRDAPDEQGTSFYISPQIESLVGYTPDDWLNDPHLWQKMLHPEDRQRAVNDIAQNLLVTDRSSIEYRLVTRDGRVVWVRDESVIVRDSAGQPQFVQGVFTDVTERKRAEETLQKSEQSFRLMFAANPSPMWVYDLETLQFLEVNEAAIAHYGYSRDEFLQMKLIDIRPPEDVPRLLAEITGERPELRHSGERRHCLKNGQIIFVQIASHTLDFAGRPAAIVVVEDVTERKLAEEALMNRTAELYESEQRYRRLFTSAQRQAQEMTLLDQVRTLLARKLELNDVLLAIADAVKGIFPDTRVTLYFREGDELAQQGTFSDHTQIHRIPINKGIMSRVARTGQPVLLEDVNSDPEFIRVSPDIVSEVCVPLLDQEKVVGVLNVESVNNTKLGEADLQLMLALSTHIGLAIGRARLYTAVRESHDSVQEQAVEIAALYRALTQLLNPGDVTELAQQIAATMTQEFNFANCGVLLVNEAETELNRVAHAGPTRDPNAPALTLDGPGLTIAAYHSGQMVYAADVLDDPRYVAGDSTTRSELVVPLQARKRVLGVLDLQSPAPDAFDERAQRILMAYAKHAALALENLQLLARLEKAYQALRTDQEQLIIAEKMASLGRLTAGIAHEMNTPLATVRATLTELHTLAAEYAASIDDPNITPDDHREIAQEIQQSIQIADKAAERAAGFVRSIKLQTRTSGPRAYVTFNAVPVIQESLLLLGHALRRSHCAAHFAHGDAYHVALHGSPGQLGQVITNLVTNAIDASAERGGGPIVVQLTKHETEVELQVSDSGTGISPENLPRIFDPMFTTKPFGEGTGLGLTIVHDIVTGHFAGTIGVNSQPGQGTTFILRIPLSAANEPDAK